MYAKKHNYSALVDFLSQYSSQLTLPRLRELHLRNLLFYQAELLFLKRELDEIEQHDALQHPNPGDRVTYAWYPSMARKPEPTSSASLPAQTPGVANSTDSGTSLNSQHVLIREKYCERVLEIRETLAKYNEALAHYVQQDKLPSPPERHLRLQHEWLLRSDHGGSFLSGTAADAWRPDAEGKFHTHDYMTFTASEGPAFLFARTLMSLRLKVPWRLDPGRILSIDGSSQGGIAQGISVVIACIGPVLPIVVLVFIETLLVRVGLILVFTAVSAAILVFGLKLEPEKVLTITSAMAAVQVVFVGSTPSTH